jgi:PleD family two-component response regulator
MPAKILVVDDAPLNRRLLISLLQPEGYVLLEAGNGREAVELALRELPDLIMLDIIMPLMDGYEACSLLKQDPDSKNIPIIFISCIHDESVKIKCLELGVSDYITKPFNKAEVCIRVRNQVQLYQMTKALRTANQQLCEKQQRLDEDLRSAASFSRHKEGCLSGPTELQSALLQGVYSLSKGQREEGSPC